MSKIVIRIIKFGIIGSSGIIVNQSILYLFVEYVKLDYRISSIIAIECSIISNFFFNSIWTWGDRRVTRFKEHFIRLIKFNLSTGFTSFAFNWTILVLLTELLQMNYLFSNLIGIAIAAGINFFISHFWTFSSMKIQDNNL